LALAFFFAIFCVSVLLRRQWLDYDRLTFPLTHPPLEMTEGVDEPRTIFAWLLRQRLIWLGALIPFVVHSVNGLHFYFPAVPEIRLSFPLNQYLTSYLFSQIGPFIAIVHFSVIGVAFLLPSDLAFSLWFFFFVFMGQSVLLTYWGWQLPNFPGYATPAHAGLQMLGAFFAIVTHLILVGRKHWRQVITNETPSDEPISYRTALLGFLLCIGFATLWCSVAGSIAEYRSSELACLVCHCRRSHKVCQRRGIAVHPSLPPLRPFHRLRWHAPFYSPPFDSHGFRGKGLHV
jgi:hypothetical protein